MTDFQKSVMRFMYVALGVAAVVLLLSIFQQGDNAGLLANELDSGYGAFDRSPHGVNASGTCVVNARYALD